jgi:hypothetical protein
MEAREGWHTLLGVMHAANRVPQAGEVRRLHLAALEAETVAALLVGGDEQDVGASRHFAKGKIRLATEDTEFTE